MRRNRDKPHRCPKCHSIPARARRASGPRTRVSCGRCGVQWRMGSRTTNATFKRVYRLAQSAALYPHGWYLLNRIENERHAR